MTRPSASGPLAPAFESTNRHRLRAAASLLLWLLGLALMAWRFAGLDLDPLPVSGSGDMLTDESWFLKAALLKSRFGAWTLAGDFNPVTHNALHTLLVWVAFCLGGESIVSARAVCTGLYAAGAVALAGAYARRVRSPLAGGLVLCLTAGHFFSFVYSRLAFTDVSATGFSMLALAAWYAAPRRRLAAGHLLALLLAGGSLLCKASYLPVWIVLGAALAWRVARTQPDGRRRWLAGALAVAVVPVSVLLGLRYALPVDWAFFQKIIADQLDPMTPAAYAARARALIPVVAFFIGWRPLCLVLVAGIAGGGFWVRRQDCLEGRAGPAHTRDEEVWVVPLLLTLALFGQTAVTDYWPERRMLLFLPLLSLLAVSLLLAGARVATTSLLQGLVGVAGAALLFSAWWPQYQEWTGLPPIPLTARHSFTDLAGRIRALPNFPAAGPVVVASNASATTLALDLPSVRPVDIMVPGDPCRFLKQVGARFLVLNERVAAGSAEARVAVCPQVLAAHPQTASTLLMDYHGVGQTRVFELPSVN